MASNHGDIGLWLKKFGYTFADYRYWVQTAIDEGVEVEYVDVTNVNPTLRRGDSGDDVKRLQQRLRDLGYGISVDGKYGSATEQAVKDFQEEHGLVADGVVGAKTWAALDAAQPTDEYVKMLQSDYEKLRDIVLKYEQTVG